MSVDTNALLIGAPSPEEIGAALRAAGMEDLSVAPGGSDGKSFWVIYAQPPKGTRRSMFLMPNYAGEVSGFGDVRDLTLCNLGAIAGSVETMEALSRYFGGYVRDNDSDSSEWRAVEKTGSAPDVPPLDRLRIDLFAAVGSKRGLLLAALADEPDVLEAVMEAFDGYRAARAASPAPGR